MKHFRLSIFAAAAMLFIAACDTPKATYVNFGTSTYSFDEGTTAASIRLYEYQTAYLYPVQVTVKASVETGTKPDGSKVTIGEMIAFDEPSFTVTEVDKYNLLLEGIEIGVSNDTTIPFTVLDNDYLQGETFSILFTIEEVKGSEKGTTSTTTLTIVDDEYAPRLTAGYYKAKYDKVVGSGRGEESGEFTFKLTKTGKYEYVMESLFDIYPPRPRLVGTFDSTAHTLTFNGTDYDELILEEDDSSYDAQNAFNRIFFFNNDEKTSVLVFEGGGADGIGNIIFSTDDIAENAKGYLKDATSGCGFYTYAYNPENETKGAKTGVWDAFDTAEVTYIGATLPYETRSISSSMLIPFK